MDGCHCWFGIHYTLYYYYADCLSGLEAVLDEEIMDIVICPIPILWLRTTPFRPRWSGYHPTLAMDGGW